MVTRREVLATGGMAAVGALAISSTACDKKDIDFYVSTVGGALEELKPLLPAQVALLSKGISIAKSFNDAYQDGKFDSAITLFENLVGVINEVIAAAGVVVSDTVKIILAVAGVGTRAIAVLLRQQAQTPAVASAIQSRTGARASSQRSLIERMASRIEINAVFEASKP
jgi:hypothetical protein